MTVCLSARGFMKLESGLIGNAFPASMSVNVGVMNVGMLTFGHITGKKNACVFTSGAIVWL